MSNHDLNLGTVSPAVANMINRGETTVHRSHDLPRNIERDLIDLLVKLLDGEYSRSEIIDVLVALLKGGDLDRSDLVELLSALLDSPRSRDDLVLLLVALLLVANQIEPVASRESSLNAEFRELLAQID